MTTELIYLAATLVLALVQILIPAAARDMEFGLAWGGGTVSYTHLDVYKRQVSRVKVRFWSAMRLSLRGCGLELCAGHSG